MSAAASEEPNRDGSLAAVIPFSYLPVDRRRSVESRLRYHVFGPGEIVFRAGSGNENGNEVEGSGDGDGDGDDEDGSDRYRMYICITGGFVYSDPSTGRVAGDDLLLSGSYFGERAAIFRTPRDDDVRSAPRGTSSAWSLGSDVVVSVLREHNPAFALALASDLRHTQGIFDPFLAFNAFAFSAFHEPIDRPLDMGGLLDRYRMLKPALHPHVNDEHVVDYGAWGYALRRLPRTITRSYNIVCSKRVINVLGMSDGDGGGSRIDVAMEAANSAFTSSSASSSGPGAPSVSSSVKSQHGSALHHLTSSLSGPGTSVSTDARRRTGWEVMPGKLFVLLRELQSDYLDVITCLCIHTIELTKLWRRLRPIAIVAKRLTSGLDALECAESDEERERIVDGTLGGICGVWLDGRDHDGLRRLWPKDEILQRLLDVVVHHGDYTVYLDKRGNSVTGNADERWSRRVRELAVEVVGEFDNVPGGGGDLVVDVVSSNTHSVLNCLSPYIHSSRDVILAWGRENLPALFEPNNGLDDDMDRLYPAAKGYFKAHPDEAERARETERECGMRELIERDLTGINVQLFDVNKLKSSGRGFDDLIPGVANLVSGGGGGGGGGEEGGEEKEKKKRHLLINIDYCFGSQGENILRLLLLTFGHLIRSVNVIGKAGGLASDCERGDILYPTHVLDENQGGEMRTVDNVDVSPAELCKMSKRRVHVGPVITVLGTVLQSTELLLFYERLWHATGMEMEASWYLRAIDEAQNLGLLASNSRTRFLYYVSDTPLKPSSSLAESMSLGEGIPPLYAITRLVLGKVLTSREDEEEDVAAAEEDMLRGSTRSTVGELPAPAVAVDATDEKMWNVVRDAVQGGLVRRPSRCVVRQSFIVAGTSVDN